MNILFIGKEFDYNALCKLPKCRKLNLLVPLDLDNSVFICGNSCIDYLTLWLNIYFSDSDSDAAKLFKKCYYKNILGFDNFY